MESICPIANVLVTAMKGDRAVDGMHNRDKTKGMQGRIKPEQPNTGGIGSAEQ